MSFRLRREESVQDNAKRVVFEQIDKSLELIRRRKDSPQAVAFELRKRCKKIRAVLRLVRPELGDPYKGHNISFQNIGRILSGIRDLSVFIPTLNRLVERFSPYVKAEDFSKVYEKFQQQALYAANRLNNWQYILEGVQTIFHMERKAIDGWQFKNNEFAAIRLGLAHIYARCYRETRRNRENATTETLHNWRKQVKYHRSHIRLLQEVWPHIMQLRHLQLKELTDCLGLDHDLAGLHAAITDAELGLAALPQIDFLENLIQFWRKELRTKASSMGDFLFLEPAEIFVNRMQIYWDNWQAGFEEEAPAEAKKPRLVLLGAAS